MDGIFISAAILCLICFLIDRRTRAKVIGQNRFQLQPGYYTYFFIVLIGFVLFTMVISVLNAIDNDPEMLALFIPITLLMVWVFIYNLIYVMNYRVIYDKDKITRINTFGKITEIKFEDLENASTTFYGIGSNILIKANNGKKIKIHALLPGFKDLKEFLDERNFLT